jgi:hypothetical protein
MPRTLYRRASGIKLYDEPKKTSELADTQTYKRAQGSAVKRSSAAERATKKKASKKKSTKKKAAKKGANKK